MVISVRPASQVLVGGTVTVTMAIRLTVATAIQSGGP